MPNADLFWTGFLSGAFAGVTMSGLIFIAAFFRCCHFRKTPE